MKERPILFKGEMVRAILDGRKTQTRRIAKLPNGKLVEDDDLPAPYDDGYRDPYLMDFYTTNYPRWVRRNCPYGKPGDRLWVRETWNKEGANFHDDFTKPNPPYYFAADYDADANKLYQWKPSIFMPRPASRITLEVVGVRVERLQAISEADAEAEGCAAIGVPIIDQGTGEHLGDQPSFRYGYAALWELINGPGSWDANPWVWVVQFKRIEA